MYTGLLVATGTLDVQQFWPNGTSDADTANIIVSSGAFQFSSTGKTQDLKSTAAFDGSKVKGQKNGVVHNKKLTIRFQGIDAPELHFAALLHKKGLKHNGTDYRQPYGETAAAALGTYVKAHMKGTACRVETRVDSPNDVFDMYGRFIGDVFVKTAGGWIDLNHWLVQNGWAYPTYYNSMRPDEIQAIQNLGTSAQNNSKGIWAHETRNTAIWDDKLVFRGKGVKPQPTKDVGPVMMPKIFRRRTRFEVSHMNDLPEAAGSFSTYLGSLQDSWISTKDFLADPAVKKAPKGQTTLKPLVDVHDMFADSPGDLVFFEAASTLVGTNGKPVTKWF
jgi:endonuclease YncB( thermonuclease family)